MQLFKQWPKWTFDFVLLFFWSNESTCRYPKASGLSLSLEKLDIIYGEFFFLLVCAQEICYDEKNQHKNFLINSMNQIIICLMSSIDWSSMSDMPKAVVFRFFSFLFQQNKTNIVELNLTSITIWSLHFWWHNENPLVNQSIIRLSILPHFP